MKKAFWAMLAFWLVLGICACNKRPNSNPIEPEKPPVKQEIKFLVRGDDGNPLPNALVNIMANGEVVATAESDAQGIVTASVDAKFANPQAQMDSSGFITKIGQQNLVRGKVVMDMNPSSGTSISRAVKFIVSDGQAPLADISIKIYKKDGVLEQELTTDSNGKAEVKLLIGSYSAKATKPGYQDLEVFFTLSEKKVMLVLNLTLSKS